MSAFKRPSAVVWCAVVLLQLLLFQGLLFACAAGSAADDDPFYHSTLDYLPHADGHAPYYYTARSGMDVSAVPTVLRLHQHFSSNMVLQRGPKQAMVWGEGVPGSAVTVLVGGEKAGTATVDGSGDWEARLAVQPLRLNTSVTVTDGTTTLNLTNVAFGDVFLCSGQSNMVLTLNFTFGGPEKVAQWASYPYMRLYSVYQYQSSATPLNESGLSYPGWVSVNTTTLVAYPGDYSTYFSAVCFFTGSAVYDSLKGQVPIGLVQSSYGGTSAEAWTSADALDACGPYNPGPNPPTYMIATIVYNAMMYPLLRVALSGVIWYQGESNGGALLQRYYCAFPNLIDNWRAKFNQPDLPWFFALLAPYASGGAGLPPLRMAQLSGLTRPRTWVANAIDLGDEQSARTDIHPRNKSYLGERLALHIRRELYGQDVVTSGPRASTVTATLLGSSLQVEVRYESEAESEGLVALSTPNCTAVNGGPLGGPCCTFGDGGQVTGLFYAQLDGQPGNAALTPTATIDPSRRTLTANLSFAAAPSVGQQLVLRMAWSQYPGCVLYNGALLPALPSLHNVTIGDVPPVDPVSSTGPGGGDEEGGLSSGVVMLAAVIGAALLVALGAVVWAVRRWRQQRGASEESNDVGGYTTMSDSLLTDDAAPSSQR